MNDEDSLDSDTEVDDMIGVTLTAGENDADNNFVDTSNGSISGTVTCEDIGALSGVTLDLLDAEGDFVATTTTGEDGECKLLDVSKGMYFVNETNSDECPINVSDQGDTDDGDSFDSNTGVNNMIGVEVDPGEEDTGNNFVDRRDAPSQSPTTSPAPRASPSALPTINPAPTDLPTRSPRSFAPFQS